jgi:hypothetical protein
MFNVLELISGKEESRILHKLSVLMSSLGISRNVYNGEAVLLYSSSTFTVNIPETFFTPLIS